MANFEKIKDVVLEYADRYAKAFSDAAPYRTGRLKNSYRGVAQISDDKFTIQIYGEYYGPFQSYGVGPAVTINVNDCKGEDYWLDICVS